LSVGRFERQVQAECVRTLYRQAPNSFAAALVVTVYMTATAAPYTRLPVLLGWLGVQAASQVLRVALIVGHRRSADPDARYAFWGRAYAGYMLVAGLVWGSCAFLFFHIDAPLSVALTLCGLYGISGGSVPGNAYVPACVHLFVGTIFAAVMIRMLMIGQLPYVVLGTASVCFALIMAMFCRVQHRSACEGFRMRFENADLLEQLRIEKAGADEARARAEQASLAKSQFLAAASHDLRQPLYALSLFSSSLQGLRLDEEAQAVVGKIHGNIAALESLFNALLDISKLDAGVVQPLAEPVCVSEVFARLEQYFGEDARQRGLELRFTDCRRWVLADPALLERILGNLISNALRYTERGRVLVGCRRDGRRLRMEVWDSGLGIEPSDRERIFEDFVQVANPERDRRKGLGLGLAIARRTAELLGARIELRSWPGKGSVFAVVLPLAEAPEAAAEPAAEAGDVMAGLEILVVDDEPSIREGLVQLLGQWGAKVATAPDLAGALELVRAGRRFGLVLADYRLGGGETGFEAIEALRAEHPAPLGCCLLTGDIGAEVLREARRRGLPLLHKPVQVAKLRAVLNHLAAAA
jgi:signal transduction histidine kinase